MANIHSTDTDSAASPALPGWWEREKQKRQLRTLVFLVLVLLLLGFFKWESDQGKIGKVEGITFDTSKYIAFVRRDAKAGTADLYAMRADGSDLRRLSDPNDKSDKQSPAWTTDGKKLLYVSNRDDAQVRQIYILGEGEPKQLTSGRGRLGSGNKDLPFANPDGQHCAFVAQGVIKTVLLNGNDPYQIMPPPRAGNEANSDTGVPEAAGELHGPFLAAAFASDGQSIAGVQEASSDDAANLPSSIGDQVARVLPAGASQALFLDSGRDVSLAWEPGGKQLACAFTEMEAPVKPGKSQLISGIRIWRFPTPTKTEATTLFVGLGYSVEPKNIAWSSDGAHLAFESWRLKGEGDRELRGIIIIDITQGGIKVEPKDADKLHYVVSAGPQGKPQQPRWSPDGSRLLFEMERPDGGHDICIINADGTNMVNLTSGVGDNVQAAWSPVLKK